jgi:hypothetical protein
MTSLRIVLVTVATFAAGCAADDDAPISSKITLDGETRTATALSFDALSPQTVTIVLAHEADRVECGWTSLDSVEISLLIGDRSTPHVIDPLDVTTPNSGRVVYTDQEQRDVVAVSGAVIPALTTWVFSETDGHNVIAQIDGELDVDLADGRHLTGAFSATPCNPR